MIGRLWRASRNNLPRAASEPFLVLWRVSLHVAEEHIGCIGGSHRKVDVFGLEDSGVRRPIPGVADVVEGDFNGVSCGCCALP